MLLPVHVHLNDNIYSWPDRASPAKASPAKAMNIDAQDLILTARSFLLQLRFAVSLLA